MKKPAGPGWGSVRPARGRPVRRILPDTSPARQPHFGSVAFFALTSDDGRHPVEPSMSGPSITTKVPGALSIATGQVSIDTTVGGVLVCAARVMTGVGGGRRRIKITNHGTTACYVGNSGLTTSTGFLLAGIVGYTVTLDTTAAVYGISAGTQTVSYVEEYDR